MMIYKISYTENYQFVKNGKLSVEYRVTYLRYQEYVSNLRDAQPEIIIFTSYLLDEDYLTQFL